MEVEGLRFVFKYDDDALDLLHIYARHMTSIDDAIDPFFEGDTRWNAERERFETYTSSHGLFWFWIEQDRAVMVVSCFAL